MKAQQEAEMANSVETKEVAATILEQLGDYMDLDETGREAIDRALKEGHKLGTYANPVDSEGVFPATRAQALDAFSEDPSLVYINLLPKEVAR